MRTTAIVLFFAGMCHLQAATVTWTGDETGIWTDGMNWSTGAPPTAVDDVVFNIGPVTVTLSGTQACATLSVNNGGYTITGTGTLNIAGNINVALNLGNNAHLTFAGGLRVNSGNTFITNNDGSYGTLTVRGSTWNAGAIRVADVRDTLGVLDIRGGMVTADQVFLGSGENGYGKLLVAAAATLNLRTNQSISIDAGLVRIDGSLQASSGAALASGHGVYELSGTVTLEELGATTGLITILGNVTTTDSTDMFNVKLDTGSHLSTPNIRLGDWSIFRRGILEITGTDSVTGFGLQIGEFTVTPPGITLPGDYTTLKVGSNQTLRVTRNLYLGNGGSLVLQPGRTLEAGNLRLGGGVLLANSIAAPGFNADTTQGFAGNGHVIGPLTGTAGTTVTASDGPLVLGDLSSTTGYAFDGSLAVGSQQVVLMDADTAQLGQTTTLAAGGSLVAINGMALGAGNSLSAAGSAEIQGRFTNNGTVNGPVGAGEALVFDDDVNGPGGFTGNITFEQGYAPGSSPAIVSFDTLNLTATTTLEIELGGNLAGEYDRLRVSGNAQLNGALAVSEINGFNVGDLASFVIVAVNGTLSGSFAGLPEGALVGSFSGRNVFITYSGGDGNDVELTTPVPVELMSFTIE